MGTLLKDTPHGGARWISLHDKELSAIDIELDSVCLRFRDGFDLIEDGQLKHFPSGRMILNGCPEGEVNCYIVDRTACESGMRFQGRELSMSELACMLRQETVSVEIFKEIYNDDTIHLRGEMLPYAQEGLSVLVVIETAGWFPITYEWDEDKIM